MSLKNTSESTKDTNNTESGFERHEIKGTPFTVISDGEGNHFGVMGKYRVTESDTSLKRVKAEVKKITWNRIVQVMMILIETNKQK